MRTIMKMLCVLAIAAATIPGAAIDASAAAKPARTAHPITTGQNVGAAPTGWGYGRGWCYWHPYVCYYR